MRIVLAVVLTLHALIHLMGFAKAFGYAALPQLAIPISRPMGLLWLLATLLLLAATVALWAAPRAFWLVGALGLVASQGAIIASWGDARFGTVANLILLAAVVYGAFAWGPFGLRAEHTRRASTGPTDVAAARPAPVVTEADLARRGAPPQRPSS